LQRGDLLRELLRWVLASLAAVLLTFVLLVFHANASTSGIVYLVVVVLFSTLAGTVLSVYLAVVSALFFDYFFFLPLHSLVISRIQDWISMFSFVVSCIVVSRVAERARRQARHAEKRREDVERLYALSQEMMLHEDAEKLIRDIPMRIERIFALEAVLLYIRDEDQLYSSVPGDSSPAKPLPGSLTLAGLDLGAQGSATEDPMHRVLRENSATSEAVSELPGGYFPMNLVFGMKSVGTLAWKPATLSLEVATSVAAQVAIAITRAHAMELSTRLEAARSADRLRTALIDSLTHELRTPLTAIRAAASTLLDGHGLDEALRTELVAIVDEESLRLDTLIGEAMEMAEINAEAIVVHPVQVHLRSFLEQVLGELRPQLNGFRVTVEADAGEAPISIDPHLIGRVLHHLLENAARYTPKGSRVTLRGHKLGNRVEFAVEDNGPGIDPQDLPHIFDKFYRGRRQTTTAKGSGMGLAIARAILTAHGGEITAKSWSGKGTSFELSVPNAILSSLPNAVSKGDGI
jgi:two-component system sensor histidine kinase KdpD